MGLQLGASRRGTELGYAEITSTFGGAGQAASLATVTGLSTTVVCDGVNPVEVEFFGTLKKLANTGYVFAYVYMDGSLLASGGAGVMAINDVAGCTQAKTRLVPSAGSHTFDARISPSSVGAQVLATAAGGLSGPAYISVVQR